MSLVQSYRSLPRAVRWAIWGGVVAVAWLAVAEPLLSFADKAGARARALESAIARDKELSGFEGDGWTLQQRITAFGSPHRPGDPRITAESFTRAVNAALDRAGVSDRSISESSVEAPKDFESLGVGAVKRQILTVTFEADAALVAAVISDLERTPEVAAISRIKLDRSARSGDENAGLLRATLTPEAWIAARTIEPPPAAPAAPTTTPPSTGGAQ